MLAEVNTEGGSMRVHRLTTLSVSVNITEDDIGSAISACRDPAIKLKWLRRILGSITQRQLTDAIDFFREAAYVQPFLQFMRRMLLEYEEAVAPLIAHERMLHRPLVDPEPEIQDNRDGWCIIWPDGRIELDYFYTSRFQCQAADSEWSYRPCTPEEWRKTYRPDCRLVRGFITICHENSQKTEPLDLSSSQ